MRKKQVYLVAILFVLNAFVWGSILNAKSYYVSTTGNDNNPGTISQPWASLPKAISIAVAGDTVFIRGGTYYPVLSIDINPQQGKGHSGSYKNYIHYFNYPGESPVFNFVNCNPVGNYNGGLFVEQAHFIHFKGLTVTNVEQKRENVEVIAIYAYNSSNLIFENMTAHDIGGNAFRYSGAKGYYGIEFDSTYFINCDAYNCCDCLPREPGATLGGAADGYKTWNEPGAFFLFKGCRAWNCSDDGFDPGTDPLTIIEDCWSFSNGSLDGDGTGFKTGGMLHDNGSKVTRILRNNIAAFNRSSGFFLLEYPDYYRTNARIYNNVAYSNQGNGFSVSRNELHPTILAVWKNNIAYKNAGMPFVNAYQSYTESNNSWVRVDDYPGYIDNPNVSISDADFVNLDKNELSQPRQPNGSLPNVGFFKLTQNSDLIDKGTNVGYPFFGSAPDMGCFETGKYITSITVSSTGGSTVINTDRGTLQLAATIAPSDASNKSITWSVIKGTGNATLNQNGLVTAVANGTITARATANDGSGVYGQIVITISNQASVPVTAITVAGQGGSNAITTDKGTLQLTATVTPSNAGNKTVTWSIANGTGQATINSSGLVTAVSNGTVTARATANDGSGIYGTLLINISNQKILVTSISVSGAGGLSGISTNKGTLQLTANILPANATNKTVSWSIQNGTGQATISSSGLVTAVANGTVTARATANDGSGIFGTLTITISNQNILVTGIAISGAGGSTTISTDNGTLQLSVNVSPANATNKEVTWSIENGTGQAAINSSGLITAVNNGSVTAKATAKDGSGVSGTLVINISNQVVTNPVTPVSSIVVTGFGGATTILTNSNLQINANVLPENATNKNITWSIQNGTGQASISATGLVTALSAGTVTAKAMSTDGSGVYGTLVLTITNQVVLVSSIAVYTETGLATITTDNGSLQLVAAISPSNTTNKQVSWSILNGSGQATINSSGLVTAVSDGLVTATATAMDGSGIKGSLIITIANQSINVSSITVSGAGGSNVIASNKGTLQMQAEVLPRNATNKTVTWSVSNGSGSATINSSGLLTAVTEGTVTVTAAANDGTGISGSAIITIAPRFVKVHTIIVHGDKFKTTLEGLHDSLQLYATIFPEEATNKKVHWTVENKTGKATINENGILKAVSYGLVTAIATSTDSSEVRGILDIVIQNIATGTSTDVEEGIKLHSDALRLTIYQYLDVLYNKATVVNLNGQILRVERIYDKVDELDISYLLPGIYIIILQNDQGDIITEKFRKE